MNYQPPHHLLEQRLIVVTGAGDGIGRTAALTYARYGANLILVGKTEQKLLAVQQQILQETGKNAYIYPLDLLQLTTAKCSEFSSWLAERFSHLDGVLHNASILGDIVPIIEQDPAVWQDVMQVNVNATFMLTQVFLPFLLRAPHASIIFTSSSVGRQGRKQWGAYAASKFATEGLMQVLADEYQDSSLRFNCINPGGTRTNMRASAFPSEDPQILKTPDEIMSLYLYLMGDDSIDKNGQSFDAQPNKKPGISQ